MSDVHITFYTLLCLQKRQHLKKKPPLHESEDINKLKCNGTYALCLCGLCCAWKRQSDDDYEKDRERERDKNGQSSEKREWHAATPIPTQTFKFQNILFVSPKHTKHVVAPLREDRRPGRQQTVRLPKTSLLLPGECRQNPYRHMCTIKKGWNRSEEQSLSLFHASAHAPSPTLPCPLFDKKKECGGTPGKQACHLGTKPWKAHAHTCFPLHMHSTRIAGAFFCIVPPRYFLICFTSRPFQEAKPFPPHITSPQVYRCSPRRRSSRTFTHSCIPLWNDRRKSGQMMNTYNTVQKTFCHQVPGQTRALSTPTPYTV